MRPTSTLPAALCRPLPTLILAVLSALTMAPGAAAYGVEVHGALPLYAFDSPSNEALLPAVTPAQLHEFRRRFYETAAKSADPDVRRRFLARYPTRARFDAEAFKQFLGLNPERRVWGLDEGPAKPIRRGTLLCESAVRPDTDRRNQDRLLRRADGTPLRLADGRLVPVDPMILAIGNATGLSSQAHAHYGLARGPMSESPEVLQRDPRHFAVPADIETFAAPMAQTYTDLAIMAGQWGQPTIAVMHEGAFQHHAADVGNQIHTVQVGLYDFFFDAKLQSFKDWLFSLGGLRRPARAFRDIGIQILTNHHVLSEAFFVKRLGEARAGQGKPEVQAALTALRQGDPAFRRRLRTLGTRHPAWAEAMTSALIDVSSQEGAELYAVTRSFADRRLSQAGVAFDGADPDRWVQPESGASGSYARYYGLYRAAFGRIGEIFRAWREAYGLTVAQPHADRAAAERLVRRQLSYWERAERRRAAFLTEHGSAAAD